MAKKRKNKLSVKKGKNKFNCSKSIFKKITLTTFLVTILFVLGFLSGWNILIQNYEKQLTVSAVLDTPSQEQLTNKEIDFPNTEAGTFAGFAGEKYFREPIEEVVVLFASAKIPGIAIIYYPEEKKIIAGSPQMTIENIKLFNGVRHQIAYSFKKGDKQRFYYDGNLKAEMDFKLPVGDKIAEDKTTGMSTLKKNKPILSTGLEEIWIS
jgi:hypothetical protein